MYTVELIEQMHAAGITEKRTKRWLSEYSVRTGEVYDRHVSDDVAAIIRRLPDIMTEHRGLTISDALDIATGDYVPAVSANGAKQIMAELTKLQDKINALFQLIGDRTEGSDQANWQQVVSTSLDRFDRRLTDVTARMDHHSTQFSGFLLGEEQPQ